MKTLLFGTILILAGQVFAKTVNLDSCKSNNRDNPKIQKIIGEITTIGTREINGCPMSLANKYDYNFKTRKSDDSYFSIMTLTALDENTCYYGIVECSKN